MGRQKGKELLAAISLVFLLAAIFLPTYQSLAEKSLGLPASIEVEMHALTQGAIIPLETPADSVEKPDMPDFPVRSDVPMELTGNIAFESNRTVNYDIFVQNADSSSSAVNLISGSGNDVTPVWSPDGEEMVFASDRDGDFDVYLLTSSGAEINLTQSSSWDDFHPTWSPNGNKIVFSSNRSGSYYQIYTMNPDGSNVQQIGVIPGNNAMYPHYSPDGNKIVYMRATVTAPICLWNWDVWVMDTNGGNQQQITTQLGADLYPNWTPEGDIIYASCRNLLDFDLYTIDPITYYEVQNTNWFLSNEWGATFSPDANYIAFNSDYSGNTEVYTVLAGGGTASNFTQNAAEDLAASWGSQAAPDPLYSISGKVTDIDGNPISGVNISAGFQLVATTDILGNYILSNLEPGTYILTPQKEEDTFLPPSATVILSSSSITDVNFLAQKPVIVLVHGFQGLVPESDLKCNPENINQNDMTTEVYHWGSTTTDPGKLDAKNYWAAMPTWLVTNNFDIWIAQLETGKSQGTRSLFDNARCLRNQIKYVYEKTNLAQRGQKIIVISHSMGGLVSRKCLYFSDCGNEVNTLITLGSPHAGLPAGWVAKIGLKCKKHPGACDMDEESMIEFNSNTPTSHQIQYNFIGGDGTGGPRHWQQKLWELLGSGPNDGLVGKYSAVGWNFDNSDLVIWALPSYPKQYWTDEFHSTSYSYSDNTQIRNDYYHYRLGSSTLKSHAYDCLIALLNYQSVPSCAPATGTEIQASSNYNIFQSTSFIRDTISTGQTLSRTLQIDTSGETLFYLSWYTGTLNFSLKDPNGQVIDPNYAANNPNLVAYGTGLGGTEIPPFVTYSFTNTILGEWTLVVDASTLGASETDIWAFGLLETDRTMDAGVDGYYYNPGDTAVLTATLQNNGVGINGVNVTAEIVRSDGVTVTVTLIDQGEGNYAANYTLPNAPGYLNIAMVATGNDNGTEFTRQSDLLAVIAPQDAQFTNVYSDQGNDDNGDSYYEYLNFSTQVDVTNPGDYIVSALLLSENGQLITNVAVDFFLTTGTHTVVLPFDGDDIRSAKMDGPYTIANLQITEITSGIPSQIIDDAWTTGYYDWEDFGSSPPDIYLPFVIR